MTVLDPDQEAALASLESRKVILAGPGSGKTTTVVEEVTRAVARGERVILMTFTNSGAREFRDRIGDIELEWCGTTHGYCAYLVRTFGSLVGYKGGSVAVLSQTEAEEHLLAARDTLGLTKRLSKAALLEKGTEESRFVWKEYGFILKQNNLIDFDTLLIEGARILVKLGKDAIIPLCDLLVVDEVQDSSRQDWAIYNNISCGRATFVGDLDQEIFTFRGADNLELMQEIAAGKAVLFRLERNYRSGIAICHAATNLIRHNIKRIDKETRSMNGDPARVIVQAFDTVSDEISLTMQEGGPDWDNSAVLLRENQDAEVIRLALMGAGVPVAKQIPKMRDEDMQRALTIIALADTPYNDVVASRYLKMAHLPEATVRRMRLEATATGSTIGETITAKWTDMNIHTIDRLLMRSGMVSRCTLTVILERIQKLPQTEPTLTDLLLDLRSDESEQKFTPGIYVGTMHCSPPDEQVLTTHGYKRISEITSSDRLMGFNGACNQLSRGLNGKKRGHAGYKATLKSRFYSGPMLTLRTAETCTRVTPEHRVRARFTDRFYGKWIVYLMRRGGWWRIGMCTSAQRPYVSGGLGGRLATEKADDGWILGVYARREVAIQAEQIYQVKYGVPSLRFENTHGSGPTTEELHFVHNSVQSYVEPNIARLAADVGILLNAPLYTRQRKRVAHASAWFETVAANLLSYYMAIPVATDMDWRKKSPTRPRALAVHVSRADYSGRVFSLDVPPYGFYVSGGAIVHNSAKGREWDRVFLPAFEQGIIPSLRVDDIEEERRLAFVALTRARFAVYITSVSIRPRKWGGPVQCKPSQFIKEIYATQENHDTETTKAIEEAEKPQGPARAASGTAEKQDQKVSTSKPH